MYWASLSRDESAPTDCLYSLLLYAEDLYLAEWRELSNKSLKSDQRYTVVFQSLC